MLSRAFAAPFFLLAALSSCAPEPFEQTSEGIMGGADSARAGVVLVAITDALGRVQTVCTGTLVAPTLVLTARHCVGDVVNGSNPSCTSGPMGEPASVPTLGSAARRTVYTGATLREDAFGSEVESMAVPPGPTTLCAHDLALLRLAEPLPAAAVVSPRLDDPVTVGERFVAAGYGGTTPTDHDPNNVRRRERDGRVVREVGARTSEGVSVRLDGEWEGDGSICPGDSGGPALDSMGRTIGVASRALATNTECSAGVYTALGPHAEWLRAQAIAAAEAGGYAPPSWATTRGGTTAGDAGSGDGAVGDGAPGPAMTAGGCSVVAPGAGPSSRALGCALALGLALRGLARRARPPKRARSGAV